MTLPNGIYYLDYSEKQRLFHFDDNQNEHKGKDWVRLKAMSEEDCLEFTNFMDKKYVNDKTFGELPELEVVEIELKLFFLLKSHKRKLVKR